MTQLLSSVCTTLLLAEACDAAIYVCEVKHFYEMDDDQLVVPPQEAGLLHTWPVAVFDDDSGSFKYGSDGRNGAEPHWTEETMTVTAKGSNGWGASGHYMHNGTLLNAIVINSWEERPSFLWLGAGLADVAAGTCQKLGS